MASKRFSTVLKFNKLEPHHSKKKSGFSSLNLWLVENTDMMGHLVYFVWYKAAVGECRWRMLIIMGVHETNLLRFVSLVGRGNMSLLIVFQTQNFKLSVRSLV